MNEEKYLRVKHRPMLWLSLPLGLLGVLACFKGLLEWTLQRGAGTLFFGGAVIVVASLMDRRWWTCGHCGNRVEETTKICGSCGVQLRRKLKR